MVETPKEVEQQRRDKNAQKESVGHECIAINSDTPIPTNWRQFLSCRHCKKKLTAYIGNELLAMMPALLRGQQQFFCNIGRDVVFTDNTGETSMCPYLWTNAKRLHGMASLHSLLW